MPDLVVQKFWTHYLPDRADPAKLVGHDYVAYGPVGSLDRTVITTSVAGLQRLQPLEGSQNPAVHMAHARWNAIKPAYDAWKAGQEPPEEGTALAAWNAVSPEQADILKRNGIKTVEQIAALTDAHTTRLPLPGVKDLVRQAKNFIDAAEQTRFSAKLAEKDNQVAALEAANAESAAQIAELMEKVKHLAEMVAQQQAEAPSEPEKRRPGRPPKNPETQAA